MFACDGQVHIGADQYAHVHLSPVRGARLTCAECGETFFPGEETLSLQGNGHVARPSGCYSEWMVVGVRPVCPRCETPVVSVYFECQHYAGSNVFIELLSGGGRHGDD